MTYKTNEHGIITSPGKFEGEPDYVPHYWEMALQGLYDADGDGTFIFTINREDCDQFPGKFDLGDRLELYSDCNGFVHSRVRSVR